jgi:isoamylase
MTSVLGGDNLRMPRFRPARPNGLATVTLPSAPAGLAWYRVANTATFLESEDNIVVPGMETAVQATYLLDARALVLLLAK